MTKMKPPMIKDVVLVSQVFIEINIGFMIVVASGHSNPVSEADLDDPDRDPDEHAGRIMLTYLEHVEGSLATTEPPQNTELAVASGLLRTPVLDTTMKMTAHQASGQTWSFSINLSMATVRAPTTHSGWFSGQLTHLSLVGRACI